MPLWKTTLSYDGTDFHGWQVQPGLRTVQGELRDALRRVTGEAPLPQGAGRTDAGVHALAQVASFALASPIPAGSLQRALNARLPPAIRITAITAVDPPFHARHSARWKTYEYSIFPRQPPELDRNDGAGEPRPDRICPPHQARYVWDCAARLDLALLQAAADEICGTHDFTSFAATGAETADEDYVPRNPLPDYPPTPPSPCRTVSHSHWQSRGGLLVYTVRGTGFLHHMVRNLVGTLVLAGAGRLAPGSLTAILAARRRAAAGPTAPARGLHLRSVEY